VYESSIVKNLDFSTGGGVLVNFHSLTDMSSFKDVTPTVDSLHGLQHLYSPHCSSKVVPIFFMLKKTTFVKELKIISKWDIMIERKYSNSEEDDESIQTTKKPGRGMPMKINTKSSKINISKML